VAFLRFSRDKRGYEHFSLVQPTTNRRGATRQRVLYMYRTPPDVKVGREPFDAAVRRALETQYPDVAFDWRKILETPIPSADAERWRERRRAERAARQAASAEAAAEDADADSPADLELPPPIEVVNVDGVAASDAVTNGADVESPAVAAAPGTPPVPTGDAVRRRRRRRRGRRGRPEGAVAASAPTPGADAGSPVEAADAAPADAPGDEESADAPLDPPGE
jgi:hypothetical protein